VSQGYQHHGSNMYSGLVLCSEIEFLDRLAQAVDSPKDIGHVKIEVT